MPQHHSARDHALGPRRRPANGARYLCALEEGRTSGPHLAARAQEGREAVRRPQAHPEAGSAMATRRERGPGRVPPRRGGSDPQEASQADLVAATEPGLIGRNHPHAGPARSSAQHSIQIRRRFLNIVGKRYLASSSPSGKVLAEADNSYRMNGIIV